MADDSSCLAPAANVRLAAPYHDDGNEAIVQAMGLHQLEACNAKGRDTEVRAEIQFATSTFGPFH